MVSMMMDEALVLGIAIPAVAALTCASVGMRLAALHMTTTELGMQMNDKRHVQPLCTNLIVSLLLGAALNCWFYVDNASQVAGSSIAFVGIPLAILIGTGSSLLWLKSNQFDNTMEPTEVLAAPDSDLTNEQNIVHHNWMKKIANVTQRQHHGSPAEPQPIGTSLHGVPILLMGAEFKHPK